MPLTTNLLTLFTLSGQRHIEERRELRKMFTGPRVGCTVFFWEGTLFTLVIAFIDGVCSTGSFQTQLWRITLASIHTSAAHTNQLSPSSTQKPTSKKVTRSQPSNQPRIVFSTVCCRFGSWRLVLKLNFCSDFEHKGWSRFCSWSSGKILKLDFVQHFAADVL